MLKADAWRMTVEAAKARAGAAGHRSIPSDVTGSTGGFPIQYQRLRAYVNQLDPPVAPLPEYRDVEGVAIVKSPGQAGNDRAKWQPDFRYFYEHEVQPGLDHIKERIKEKQRSAKEALDAHQEALAARNGLAGPRWTLPEVLVEMEIASSAPDPKKLAEMAYEAQLAAMDDALKHLGVYDTKRLLSALLLRRVDPTVHKEVYDAVDALLTEREEASNSPEELAFVHGAFDWSAASEGMEMASSGGASSGSALALASTPASVSSASNEGAGSKRPRPEAPNSPGLVDLDKMKQWWDANGGFAIVEHDPETWATELSDRLATAVRINDEFKRNLHSDIVHLSDEDLKRFKDGRYLVYVKKVLSESDSSGHGGGDGGTVARSLGALPGPVHAVAWSTGEEEETETYRSLGAEPSPPPAYRSLGEDPSLPPMSPPPQCSDGLGAPLVLQDDAPAAATTEQPSQSLTSLTLRQKIARLMLARLYRALEPGSQGE